MDALMAQKKIDILSGFVDNSNKKLNEFKSALEAAEKSIVANNEVLIQLELHRDKIKKRIDGIERIKKDFENRLNKAKEAYQCN